MQERDIFLITRRDQIAFHNTAHVSGRRGRLPRQSNVINSHDHLHSLRSQLNRTGAD